MGWRSKPFPSTDLREFHAENHSLSCSSYPLSSHLQGAPAPKGSPALPCRKRLALFQGQHLKIRNSIPKYPQEQVTCFAENTRGGNSISHARDKPQELISSRHPFAKGFLQNAEEEHCLPGKHKVIRVGRELWRSSNPTPPLRQGHQIQQITATTGKETRSDWWSGTHTGTIPKLSFQHCRTENVVLFINRVWKCHESSPEQEVPSQAPQQHGCSWGSGSGKGAWIPSWGGCVPVPSAPGMPSQALQLYPQPGEKKLVKQSKQGFIPSFPRDHLQQFQFYSTNWEWIVKIPATTKRGIKNYFMQSLINKLKHLPAPVQTATLECRDSKEQQIFPCLFPSLYSKEHLNTYPR